MSEEKLKEAMEALYDACYAAETWGIAYAESQGDKSRAHLAYKHSLKKSEATLRNIIVGNSNA